MKKAFWNMMVVLLLLSFAAPDKESERFMQDLHRCAEQVKKTQDIGLEIGYSVYHSATSKEVAEQARGSFCRKGDKTYYHLLGTTFIQNKEMLVMVDDSTQRVMVCKPGSIFNPVEQQMNPAYLKAFTKSISSKETGKDQVYYRLEMKDAEVKAIGVIIDRKENAVEKMELYYAQEVEVISSKGVKSKVLPRLEITYTASANKVPESIFDTGKIVQKGKKGFTLAAPYKKYQLIDQYHNKTR